MGLKFNFRQTARLRTGSIRLSGNMDRWPKPISLATTVMSWQARDQLASRAGARGYRLCCRWSVDRPNHSALELFCEIFATLAKSFHPVTLEVGFSAPLSRSYNRCKRA